MRGSIQVTELVFECCRGSSHAIRRCVFNFTGCLETSSSRPSLSSSGLSVETCGHAVHSSTTSRLLVPAPCLPFWGMRHVAQPISMWPARLPLLRRGTPFCVSAHHCAVTNGG